jgi:hypothetical protein
MDRPSRFRAATLALVLTLTAAGCGLFEPREPDDPQDPPPRHQPTAPESVLFNFKVALEYKVVGASQLAETLDPDFRLVIYSVDRQELNGLEEIFKSEFERANRDFLSLRVGGNEVLVTFGEQAPEVVSSDSAFYDDLPYTIEINPPAGQGSDPLEVIEGEVDLGMKSRTTWAIASWTDQPKEGSGNRRYGYYMGFYSGLAAPGDILK